MNLSKSLAAAAASLVAAGALAQSVSGQTDTPGRALSAGRPSRRRRAPARPEADRSARPAGRDRQPPGATGTIGASLVAKSPPDGYTLLLGTSNELSMSPGLYDKLPYNPSEDFTPLTPVIVFPNILVVHPSLPAKTVAELVALARLRPGQLNFATSGLGSTNHLSAEVFRSLSKIRIAYVPYKGGGPAVTDLMGGHVDAMFATMPSAVTFVQSGKLKALVVTDDKRWTAVPAVPSAKEAGLPGLVIITWNGVLAPAGMAAPLAAKLHADIVRVTNTQDMKDRMAVLAA
jgi:tripartite-type tricarboxylate transporter receptor subunit TctC